MRAVLSVMLLDPTFRCEAGRSARPHRPSCSHARIGRVGFSSGPSSDETKLLSPCYWGRALHVRIRSAGRSSPIAQGSVLVIGLRSGRLLTGCTGRLVVLVPQQPSSESSNAAI